MMAFGHAIASAESPSICCCGVIVLLMANCSLYVQAACQSRALQTPLFARFAAIHVIPVCFITGNGSQVERRHVRSWHATVFTG